MTADKAARAGYQHSYMLKQACQYNLPGVCR
jgi:hypothetical protein